MFVLHNRLLFTEMKFCIGKFRQFEKSGVNKASLIIKYMQAKFAFWTIQQISFTQNTEKNNNSNRM